MDRYSLASDLRLDGYFILTETTLETPGSAMVMP